MAYDLVRRCSLRACKKADFNTTYDKSYLCQGQAIAQIFFHTAWYGAFVVLLHSEYMNIRWGVFPWRLQFTHASAVGLFAAACTIVGFFIGAYGIEAYGLCFIKTDVTSKEALWFSVAYLGCQLIMFVIVIFMSLRLRSYMWDQSLLVSKPLVGTFFGGKAIYAQLTHHMPFLRIAFVGVLVSFVSLCVEVGVLVDYLVAGATAKIENIPFAIFPIDACVPGVFATCAFFCFVLPERAFITQKVFKKLGLWSCLLKCSNQHDILVEYAIDESMVNEAASQEAAFNDEMVKLGHKSLGCELRLSTSPRGADAAMDMDLLADLASPKSPSGSLSPRGPLDQETIIESQMDINPAFGKIGDAEKEPLSP